MCVPCVLLCWHESQGQHVAETPPVAAAALHVFVLVCVCCVLCLFAHSYPALHAPLQACQQSTQAESGPWSLTERETTCQCAADLDAFDVLRWLSAASFFFVVSNGNGCCFQSCQGREVCRTPLCEVVVKPLAFATTGADYSSALLLFVGARLNGSAQDVCVSVHRGDCGNVQHLCATCGSNNPSEPATHTTPARKHTCRTVARHANETASQLHSPCVTMHTSPQPLCVVCCLTQSPLQARPSGDYEWGATTQQADEADGIHTGNSSSSVLCPAAQEQEQAHADVCSGSCSCKAPLIVFVVADGSITACTACFIFVPLVHVACDQLFFLCCADELFEALLF